MKQNYLRLLSGLAVSTCILMTACKKSNSDSSSTGFTATAGTSTFVAGQVIGDYETSLEQIALTGIQVKPGDSTILEVYIPLPINLNKAMDFNSGAGVTYYDFTTGIGHYGDEMQGKGTVTVTAWDSLGHKIAGTFNGVLNGYSDSLVITNGHFNNTYTVSP